MVKTPPLAPAIVPACWVLGRVLGKRAPFQGPGPARFGEQRPWHTRGSGSRARARAEPRAALSPSASMFPWGSLPPPGLWNQRWQGKWHARFPGAGLRAPSARVRWLRLGQPAPRVSGVAGARSGGLGGGACLTERSPDVLDLSLGGGRRRRAYGPRGRQEALARHSAAFAFFPIT